MRSSYKLAALCVAFVLGACSSPANGGGVSGAPPEFGGAAAAPATTGFVAHGREIVMASGRGTSPWAPTIMFLKGVDYAPTPICSGPLDNPLGNKNRAIWKRDLATLRTLNVNAIKVYNANPNADPIGDFLSEAYNNGKNPIYVILSIFFPGKAALNPDAVADLKGQYRKLAQVNGVYPAVIGMSIGSEVNAEDLIANPTWWKGMSEIARGAKEGFKLAGQPEKFLTTTMVDDGMNTVREGEKNNFPIDVWGINAYRGPKFGELWSSYQSASKKPFIVSEWGTPAAYHPGQNPSVAKEFPPAKMSELTDYVGGLAQQMYEHSTLNGGPGSGGFYFEFNDEWWKANDQCIQLPGPSRKPDPKFAGGFDDEAWFGLNIISAGNPNVLTPRPTYSTLQSIWANQ